MDDAETMPNCSPAHSSDALIVSGIYTPTGDLDLEPFDGMEFESEEAAKAFYNSYARRVGFSTRVSSSRRSRKDGAIIQRSFVCSKEGFRNLNEKRTKDREIKRPRTITRVGCKAALSVKIQDSGKWVVSNFVKEHNHELVPPDQVHCLRSHRQISGPAKTLIDTLQAAGMGPRRIMSALIKEYGGISKMHAENPDFFYAVQGDEDQCVAMFGNLMSQSQQTMDEVIRSAIMQRSDSMNSIFDGYVNASTNLKISSSKLYEKALDSRHEKEEELVGTLTFMATKVEDEGGVTIYQVAKSSLQACFGQYSEVTNVLTLPSHYILKRWTRNAKKYCFTLEERVADCIQWLFWNHITVRLQKKVSLAAKHDGKISLLNGRNQDDSISDGIQENLNIEDQHETFTKATL
nr:protein FAR1-RELATED SEQUENCE 5 [Ipomoea batatas]